MAKLVNLPNGQQGSFPDDMEWEDIQSVVQKQFPVESPERRIEEKKPPESLLKKAGGYANKYINQPIEDIGRQALEIGGGAGQGLANTGVGVRNLLAKGANLIPGVNIGMDKPINAIPHTDNTMMGDLLGMIMGGQGVGAGVKAAAHIEKIPYIANAMKKASDIIGKSPLAVQKAMKVGEKALKPAKNIGENALIGAAVSPENQGLGALLGGGGAALGMGLGYGVPKIANKLGIGGQPGANVTANIDPEKFREKFEASQRIGRTLTPGELTENPWVGGLEAVYKRTPQGSFENVEQGLTKVENEKNAIKVFLDEIYDNSPKSKKKINELYEGASRWNLKSDTMNKLKEDPLIQRSINRVSKSPAWQRNLKDIPENNIAYLDKVKRDLGAKEQKLKRSEGGSGEAREYELARKSLTKIMDEAVPGYKEARKEAEKSIVRKNIEKKLKKSEVSGTEFYNKILGNDIEYNKLHNKLKSVPDAQQMLSDMKKSFNSLINLKTVGQEAAQKENAWSQARNTITNVYEMSKDFLGLSDSKKSIKYLNNRKWFDDLVLAKNKEEENQVLSAIMGKLFPGGYSAIKEGNSE